MVSGQDLELAPVSCDGISHIRLPSNHLLGTGPGTGPGTGAGTGPGKTNLVEIASVLPPND